MTLNVAEAPAFAVTEAGWVVIDGAATVVELVVDVLVVDELLVELVEVELEEELSVSVLPELVDVDELPVSDPITSPLARRLAGSVRAVAAIRSEVMYVGFMGGWF